MATPVSRGLEELLARLNGVREVGPRRWKAICPSHEDRNPSLGIRLVTDGRVLLHCFGGCRTEDVLRALQLEWSALFAGARTLHARRTRRETEWERASREALEREERAAARRARWLPYWIAADHVREYSKVAAIVRAYATALGETDPAIWPILALGAAVEREVFSTEAVLDDTMGRLP